MVQAGAPAESMSATHVRDSRRPSRDNPVLARFMDRSAAQGNDVARKRLDGARGRGVVGRIPVRATRVRSCAGAMSSPRQLPPLACRRHCPAPARRQDLVAGHRWLAAACVLPPVENLQRDESPPNRGEARARSPRWFAVGPRMSRTKARLRGPDRCRRSRVATGNRLHGGGPDPEAGPSAPSLRDGQRTRPGITRSRAAVSGRNTIHRWFGD
jgi:hypothetical protein